MSKDDETQVSAQTMMSGLSLMRIPPREVHRLVTRQLSRAIADRLEEKIGALYEIKDARLAPQYPAYSYYSPHAYDAVAYGIEVHIMSKAELKAHVDNATKDLKRKHVAEIGEMLQTLNEKVKAEAKRLLEKAAL